jgi:hypothetical protein
MADMAWAVAGSVALWVLWRVPIALFWICLLDHLPAGDAPLAAYTLNDFATIAGTIASPLMFFRSFDVS